MLRPEEEEALGLDVTSEEWPHQRWKEGKPLVRLLKERHWEGLGKDSDLNQVTRQMHFKTYHPTYDLEGSHNLSHIFKLRDDYLHWALMSMRLSRCGLAEKTSRLLTIQQKVPQRTFISSGWCLPLNCPRSWA